MVVPRVASIFGGIGGALVGAEEAGFQPSYLIEPRDFADRATSSYNFPDLPLSADLTAYRHLRADVIVGNPSCAQFSRLGIRRSDRGKLHELDPNSFEYIQFMKEIQYRQPPVFILENVVGILKHKPLRATRDLVEVYSPSGEVIVTLSSYHLHVKKINVLNVFGFQKRNRVFFIGVKKGIKVNPDAWIVPPPTPKPCKLILQGLTDTPNPKLNHVFANHSAKRIEGFTKLKVGESYYGTQNNLRIDPEKPAPTIPSHRTRYVHWEYPRTLTVRECARLQGFPDNFIFHGTETSQFDQVGKSISPPVATWILKKIGEDFEKSVSRNNS